MTTKNNAQKQLQINIDQQLALKVQDILEQLGLTPTAAITLFYKRILAEGGLPFDLKLTPDQKAIFELQQAAKTRPVQDLTDTKQLAAWFADESQDN